MSLTELAKLPAVIDLVTAGRALGLGRTKTYQLAKTGQFPCRIIRIGKTYLVPTADLLALLGLQQTDGSDKKAGTDGDR
ncbi:helix-turn-helix domain-containing protein [Microtetraspora malaysiensis]|uniref:helix-turn-helix domain-containing protein n=1 Tax=Microtetraspora malaysiensis TaxID=161358 RepID=UPI000835FE35|nr:helix-turn-helix domain-containing protein [Microtetraspora malaysiensis]